MTVHCQCSSPDDETLGVFIDAHAGPTCCYNYLYEESMGKHCDVVVIDYWSTHGNYDVLP